MNIYHHRLNIPTLVTFPSFEPPDPLLHHHVRWHKHEMGDNLFSWLRSLNLFVIAGECFYTPPGRTLEPHLDTAEISDVVKLNWMKRGEGSTMDWYELKQGAQLQTGMTPINTQYSYAPRSDLIHVHSAIIGTPSLVNVGRIHGIQNRNLPRYVACAVLGDVETKKRITWDQAINIFKDYVV